MGLGWIGKNYKENLEDLANRIIMKLFFGDGELKINNVKGNFGRCYYNKCDSVVRDEQVVISDKSKEYRFHVPCFDRLVIDFLGRKYKHNNK